MQLGVKVVIVSLCDFHVVPFKDRRVFNSLELTDKDLIIFMSKLHSEGMLSGIL